MMVAHKISVDSPMRNVWWANVLEKVEKNVVGTNSLNASVGVLLLIFLFYLFSR
jgi:hypothetical protein